MAERIHTPKQGKPPSVPPPARAELIAATVLAFDHGLRRIGVALKPAGQAWALPVRVIDCSDEITAVQAVRSLVAEYSPLAVIFGLPRHSDPTQAAIVRRFVRKAREEIRGVRWLFVDEQHSSQAAEQLVRESTEKIARRGARQAPSDDLAAKIILDDYLASLPA